MGGEVAQQRRNDSTEEKWLNWKKGGSMEQSWLKVENMYLCSARMGQSGGQIAQW